MHKGFKEDITEPESICRKQSLDQLKSQSAFRSFFIFSNSFFDITPFAYLFLRISSAVSPMVFCTGRDNPDEIEDSGNPSAS